MTAKYQLIVNSDDPSELAKILAALGSSTAVATVQAVGGASVAGGSMHGSSASGEESEEDEKDGAPADPNGVDSTNLPWDDRIHSTPAQLTEKGVWRAKRGVGKNKEFVAQVEAELRARGQQQQQPVPQPPQTPAPVYQQPAPPMQTQQFPQPGQFDPNTQTQPVYQPAPAPQFPQPGHFPPPVQQSPQQFQQPAPAVQAQPQTMQQPGAPVQQFTPPTGVDFGGFMQKIQVMIGQQMFDHTYLQSVSHRVGVASITDLQSAPDKMQQAIQLMASEGKWIN